MNNLKQKIQNDYFSALKKGEEEKVSVLRLLFSEIHNREIERKRDLTDEETLQIIRSQIRKREEAIKAYKKGKREDLLQKETREKEILQSYLPPQLSEEEIEKIVQKTIKEGHFATLKDFGKVMGKVMGELRGKAEGKRVSEIVKKYLR